MDYIIESIIVVLILIFIMYWYKSNERFNTTFNDSLLEVDMDKIKNNKGYTLNDYILDDHTTYGKGIDTPFSPRP